MINRGYGARYVCPRFDFGFKRLFATEANKALLISFLNALLEGYEVIRDVTYTRNEHLGMVRDSRYGVLDVQCDNERGEKLIVEMQNSMQPFFKDRSMSGGVVRACLRSTVRAGGNRESESSRVFEL